MRYSPFGLVSALIVLVAIISPPCAGKMTGSGENIIAATAISIANGTDLSSNMSSNNTSNMTSNLTSNVIHKAHRESKVLRAGIEGARDSITLGGNISRQAAETEIGLEPKAEFNLSQRQGSVSKFKFNSDIYTPFFSRNLYARTRSTYLAPDNLSTREVYNLSGYPVIMLSNAIP